MSTERLEHVARAAARRREQERELWNIELTSDLPATTLLAVIRLCLAQRDQDGNFYHGANRCGRAVALLLDKLEGGEDYPHACGQTNCTEPALYRFTWPGEREAKCCATHRRRGESIAKGMGFDLQFTPLGAAGVADTVANILRGAEIDALALALGGRR